MAGNSVTGQSPLCDEGQRVEDTGELGETPSRQRQAQEPKTLDSRHWQSLTNIKSGKYAHQCTGLECGVLQDTRGIQRKKL